MWTPKANNKHRKNYIWSWTCWKCLFKSKLRENAFWQISHLKGFSFLWTLLKCSFLCELETNVWGQRSHLKGLNGFNFLWTSSTWTFNWAFLRKCLQQILHLNLLMLLCTESTCSVKWCRRPNALGHTYFTFKRFKWFQFFVNFINVDF